MTSCLCSILSYIQGYNHTHRISVHTDNIPPADDDWSASFEWRARSVKCFLTKTWKQHTASVDVRMLRVSLTRCKAKFNLGWEISKAQTHAELTRFAAPRCTTTWTCVKAQTLLNTNYLTNTVWRGRRERKVCCNLASVRMSPEQQKQLMFCH